MENPLDYAPPPAPRPFRPWAWLSAAALPCTWVLCGVAVGVFGYDALYGPMMGVAVIMAVVGTASGVIALASGSRAAGLMCTSLNALTLLLLLVYLDS